MQFISHVTLRWFGVERKSHADGVSACRDLEVEGVKQKGRSRKSWEECVRNDLTSLGLKRDWALDHVRWKGCMCGNCPINADENFQKISVAGKVSGNFHFSHFSHC